MVQRRKKSKWLLITTVLMIGLFFSLAAIYQYRTSLLVAIFNQWGNEYDVSIKGLDQLKLNSNGLSLLNLSIIQGKSSVELTNVDLVWSNWNEIGSIKVEQGTVVFDRSSIEQLKSSQSATSTSTIDWQMLPSLTIDRLEISLTSFEPNNFPPGLNNITVKDLSFDRLNQPMIQAEISVILLKPELQPHQPITLSANFSNHQWQGTLEFELAQYFELIKPMVRGSLQSLTLNGPSLVRFKLAKNNLDFTLAIPQFKLFSDNQLLVPSLDIQATSTLTWSPMELGPILLTLTQHQPLEMSTSTCLKLTALISVNSAVCDSELLKLPSDIQLSSPLKGRVDFDLKQPQQWQAKFENNALELSNDTDRVDIRLLDNLITPRKTQLNFLLSATSTRWPMANKMTVNARGQVNLEQQIILNIAELRFKALDLVGDDYKVKTLAFTSAKPFNIVVDNGELKPLVIEGTSSMADSEFKSLNLTAVTGKHIASYQQQKLQVDSSWLVDGVRLQSQDTVDMTKNNIFQLAGKWQLPSQALASLLKINSPVATLIPPELVLDPTLSGGITYQLTFEHNRLTNAQATSTGNIAQFNATYNDVIMSDIRGDWQCKMQLTSQFSADCQLQTQINEVDAGLVLSKVNANYRFYTEQGKSTLEVKQLNGQIFSGLFELTPFLITDFDNVDFTVKLKNIKLGQIVELQNQPGIKVTGLLKGTLPLRYSAQGFTVDQGIIESQNAGGHIEIKNNPTINQLRLSQPQLIFVLDALEDLTYSKLSSSINYQSDGWADIKVSIHGTNPDIERPIEFNYSHQENLLQLMKSLQIGDQISKQLEKIAD